MNVDLGDLTTYLRDIDDGVFEINLGGTFNFDETDFTTGTISTNGYIQFQTNKKIFIYGNDLKTTDNGITVMRDTDNKTCTIRFNCYSWYDSTDNELVFEIVIYYDNHPTRPNQADLKYISATHTSGETLPNDSIIGYLAGTTHRRITSVPNFTVVNTESALSSLYFPEAETIYVINQDNDSICWQINQEWEPITSVSYGNAFGSYELNSINYITGTNNSGEGTVVYRIGSIEGDEIRVGDFMDVGEYTIYSIFIPDDNKYVSYSISNKFVLYEVNQIGQALLYASVRNGFTYKLRELDLENENTEEITVSWFGQHERICIQKYYNHFANPSG